MPHALLTRKILIKIPQLLLLVLVVIGVALKDEALDVVPFLLARGEVAVCNVGREGGVVQAIIKRVRRIDWDAFKQLIGIIE